MEEHVRFADEHRPELLALEKGIAAGKQDIRRVKGEYLPQVAGTVDYTNTANGGSAVSDGWTMTLGAQVDLYAGGKRKHELVESRARSSKLEHQMADIKRLIELDVRQARIQVENAVSQIKTEQGNVELGKEGLRLAQLRFQEGVGTQTETLDADLALTGAESKLAQALRDYAVAHAALDKALGKGAMRESSKSDAKK
jgi:outer membrane protein TolC